MKSKTFKKLTAMMIAVMLVFSMCITGISASAAAVSDGTTVVYLKPNSNWTQSDARFAVYTFEGAKNVWTDMADEDGDGYYSVTLPEGNWEKIIFCRMDPKTTANNWNTKWNQTSDLDIPEGKNCYTVKNATWDKGGGEWSLYDPENPTDPPETDPTEATTRPITIGDPDSFYLFGYINNANYGCEEDSDNAGEYKFVDNKVTAKFDADSYVAVKKGDNSAWYMTDGWLGTNVSKAVLKNTTTLGTKANKLFVPAGKEVTFTLVDNGDDTFTLSYASSTDPTGVTEPTDPTEPTTPVDTDYYLFGSINGANYGCEEDYENMGDYKFVDGKLTVTFEEASYVGVKTTGNAAWYMTDGWQGIVNEVTLYNTSTLGETADKLMVPAGEVNFTLVVNNDGTLTLSYTAETVPTIPVNPTDPTDPEPTDPVATDYYLFGSINGANYGCEEDYENMGDYKFVDGKLTVTFEEASYVGVKTTGNAAWYMTDGWQGIVNEVTLYNTTTLGVTADKLMVPAGEVTFTLVVNDDDTLTLSYESDVVPTLPTDPVPTEPTTEPTTSPSEDEVSVFGDINLTLVKDADSNVYTGTTDLQAGTYTFRINDHGTTKCNGSAFTDTIYNVEYNPNWRSATTLNVSGGRYTFSFNADNNKLLVQFKPFSEIVELFGDINVALVKNSAGIFNGIARLEQGSYQFRINDQGTVKCNGSTFDSDSIYKVTYREDWRSASTLIAKGGVYAVKYDPATSQLTIMASPGGAGDVRIFGDIELDLLKDKGTLYSAVTTLEAGTYTFRVDDRGTIKCNGSTFNNTIYDIQYSADWKSETTFNVPGGRYLFRYDSATERLTAFDLPAVETVSVFGDFDLKLTKGTGNIYTGTIALEAGSYSFRIDEFGATMCAGHKINDKASNLEFSSEWRAAATLNATGGNYTFSYNADTNKLTVTYAK